MDKRAWVHQLKKHVEARGEENASWYVSWYDPEGVLKTKSCGPGKVGKSAAKTLADKTHSELVTGTYKPKNKTTWTELRSQYETKIVARFDEPSRMAVRMALNSFERVAKPKFVASINADAIDGFVSKRFKESASKGSSAPEATKKEYGKVSPATVNKELRYVRLILNVAKEWGIIQTVPRIRFLKQPQKLPTYILPEHFAAIYRACSKATDPVNVPNVAAEDWWRGLLVTGYMTGWRIGQLLSLKWSDIDLDEGTAIARADVTGNKGKREEKIPLHPVIIEHLKKLAGSFDTHVFPWKRNRRELWPTFQTIQEAATLAEDKPMPKAGKNGGWYGFHDLRRGFATLNASSMDLFELQALMQHKSLATTQSYVNMSKRLQKPVDNLYVPPNLRISETG